MKYKGYDYCKSNTVPIINYTTNFKDRKHLHPSLSIAV